MYYAFLQKKYNIYNNQTCFLGSKSVYVTLEHKTSHKGHFSECLLFEE